MDKDQEEYLELTVVLVELERRNRELKNKMVTLTRDEVVDWQAEFKQVYTELTELRDYMEEIKERYQGLREEHVENWRRELIGEEET